ncbi:conserved hypothetical protein [Theileria orientalis strain Shintoku]|uniref:Uncharacterized protein n=1 Tax=Theileria orientalis strain Shintoku TaxID=869250 RepID=J4CCX4_THEOR|nr:conserved hypothetical protein [Theileria orientalis strain Shintoku]PVC51858.1 hypothetical protein MACL_00001235 [Theileria orientalis]BAM40147.1 conserved hypothetical protein [Theileria orientalis strain Shintoku]|eukprot:XP_009690448.1 conserved hypothetical protein [Theileria orientalis strain Shintoku]
MNEQFWIYKERSSVRSGIAKIPIAVSLLGCAILIFLLYGISFMIERRILMDLIGVDLPDIIKILCFFSTVSLFAFLINSTAVLCLVFISSVVYFVTHSLIVSGLVQYYAKCREYAMPLLNMLYYTPRDEMFVILMVLMVSRLLLIIPFGYYSLVLYTIRKAGGTGWTTIPAFQLEMNKIPKEIEDLERRREYIKRRVEIL